MTCKPRVTCVFNTEKVDLFQANKAQEGAKAATGRTVNDVFFATCCRDYCLVLRQIPKCFWPVQRFCARPKIELPLVPDQKLNCM